MSNEYGSEEARRAEEAKRRILRENALKMLLTSEARQRLTNIRIVKPEVATLVENQIIQLASQGRIKRSITDEELKQILASIPQPKKEFKIRWA